VIGKMDKKETVVADKVQSIRLSTTETDYLVVETAKEMYFFHNIKGAIFKKIEVV
jgi:hypothetical protein